MAPKSKAPTVGRSVETLTHDEDKRVNIPTAEFQSVIENEHKGPKSIRYPRNTDLDPQLVWRGKDEQDWSDLVVNAPPLYIQEKVHPKVLIDDLLKQTKDSKSQSSGFQTDLFGAFNGIAKNADKTEFYQHEQNWTNRMILGDSLQVMASLAEREALRGKVQCVYFDPPYGIKFNSNFQWSTTSRDIKDGKADQITREPEQVKAFRDTWKDGIHSYLTYLRDRLTVARDLLTESGSIFVQIGDENVHLVRSLMDEVFGSNNCISIITVQKAGSTFSQYLGGISDFILWYAKSSEKLKYRELFANRAITEEDSGRFTIAQAAPGRRVSIRDLGRPAKPSELIAPDPLQSASMGREKGEGAASWFPVDIAGQVFRPTMQSRWKTNQDGMQRLIYADRIIVQKNSIRYARQLLDFSVSVISNIWTDMAGATDKTYVVQTSTSVVQRCILLSTDPGDIVLDPTCGSGTTAFVAEQWGRRWITIDTSRVALALARARIMGARYPFYLLSDTLDGQIKESEVTRKAQSTKPYHGNVRLGFVYERVPHITLRSIANNSEIDIIWSKWENNLQPLLVQLNSLLGKCWKEWQVPCDADHSWEKEIQDVHSAYWKARIERQREIDASIAAKADSEYLYDRPYEDKKKVRVAGPFTVESLSPHRTMNVDENDELIDPLKEAPSAKQTFPQMVMENLKIAGVQQAHRDDKISFTSLSPWPGDLICAEGTYLEGEAQKRAAIFIGPEFGTVQRADLVAAAREAGDAGFDVLIACAFNYEAHTTEFSKLGRIPVLKARMNADLHMAEDLKNEGKGNLFVIFGEPDIDLIHETDGNIRIKVVGVDVFKPQTGEVISDNADGIAVWFIDTDYNEESFFVRHAYFLGANDPYNALKTSLKAEINAEAWASLNSDTSRAFGKPKSGRIAVKVINHLGDEVMKVFKV